MVDSFNHNYALIYTAAYFASAAHAAVGQLRKYTNEPYFHHPLAVAKIVEQVEGATDEMVAAAFLHDVVEDTQVTHERIRAHFGPVVASYVFDLTDKFTPEAFPDMNRKERKEREAIRYSSVPNAVKSIKLADTIVNTPSIAEHDPNFLKTYGPEKRRLLESLRGGDADLWFKADRMLVDVGY